MHLPSAIKFYRDAYRQEYRTERLTDLYAKGNSHLHYPENFELLRQPGFVLPVDSEWGREASSELALSSSERKLIIGAFFLRGSTNTLGRARKVFAPLYLLDAELDTLNETYVVRADHASGVLNPAALDLLADRLEGVSGADLATEFPDPANPFDFAGIHALREYLARRFPEFDLSQLDQRLTDDQRIADLSTFYRTRKATAQRTLFADAALAIVNKPVKAKGVLNELEALATCPHTERSLLGKFFSTDPVVAATADENFDSLDAVVPVSLSEQQEKLITSALSAPLTLAIGPPGTGKSFTIAALALQATHEGKTVLIASKNEQACQVIEAKIERDIGVKGIALNASKPRYEGTVAARLRNIVNGTFGKFNQRLFDKYRTEFRRQRMHVRRRRKEYAEGVTLLRKWSDFLARGGGSWWYRLRRTWIDFRKSRRTPAWTVNKHLNAAAARARKAGGHLLRTTYARRLQELLVQNRRELVQLQEAFYHEHGNLRKEVFSEVDFGVVLQALPIWICKSTNVADVLPLTAGLFDLVIIDEASQCDVASSLPLLYRARAAVVVGDPRQLRHVSFLSRAREAELRANCGLEGMDIRYRDRSVLDLVNLRLASQRNVVFLDEHYRSLPDLIAFANAEFYAGQLKVMTANPATEVGRHLSFERVAGRRATKGDNPAEAAAVVDHLLRLVAADTGEGVTPRSIGLLSPLRDQVTTLRQMVRKQLTPSQIRRHRLLIDTPFGFQGEERDVMLLSLVADNETHPAVYRYLNRPDVFNVGVSRARVQQVVFHSMAGQSLGSDTLLGRYLNFEYVVPTHEADPEQRDPFFEEVWSFLTSRKSGKLYSGRQLAGSPLDIVLTTESEIFAVDLIGFPGPFSAALSVADLQRLARVSIPVFPLSYADWLLDGAVTRRALSQFLGSADV